MAVKIPKGYKAQSILKILFMRPILCKTACHLAFVDVTVSEG